MALVSYESLFMPVEMVQFLLKILWKLRILVVHHEFH